MSNKFQIEYFGDSIGTNNNIVRLFQKGQVGLLLTIKDSENLSKSQYIISREEAEKLLKQIDCLVNNSNTTLEVV